MQLTNNLVFDKFLDDEYQSRGHVEARKVVDHLRATIFKNLNAQEMEAFRKEVAFAFDMTLK